MLLGPRSSRKGARSAHHVGHGRVPVDLDEPPVAPSEGSRETIRRCVGLPAKKVLGPESPTIDTINGPAPDTEHLAVGDGDVHCIPIRMQERSRLHPTGDSIGFGCRPEVRVHPYRPLPSSGVGRPSSPRVGYTVNGFRVFHFPPWLAAAGPYANGLPRRVDGKPPIAAPAEPDDARLALGNDFEGLTGSPTACRGSARTCTVSYAENSRRLI